MNKYNNKGVYKISFPNSKFVYIGSSMKLSRRLIQTRWVLKHNKHHIKKLQDIYNTSNVFYFDVLEYVDTVDKNFLEQREQHYIDLNYKIILNRSIYATKKINKDGTLYQQVKKYISTL